MVKGAPWLIAAQIREKMFEMDKYPTVDDISTNGHRVVQPLLQLFMQNLVLCELKQTAIAQALIQAARPNMVLMPILTGLGVQLHHEFGSEFLLQ
jgi:hypothetical protein